MIAPVKKRRRNLTPLETKEQIAFVNWFRLQFPKEKFYAIPNGGKRHISVAKQLKKEGASSGVPDLCFPKWRLRIEMKRQKGEQLSDNQKEWIEYLEEECGETVLVCKGASEARRMLLEFLKVSGLL